MVSELLSADYADFRRLHKGPWVNALRRIGFENFQIVRKVTGGSWISWRTYAGAAWEAGSIKMIGGFVGGLSFWFDFYISHGPTRTHTNLFLWWQRQRKRYVCVCLCESVANITFIRRFRRLTQIIKNKINHIDQQINELVNWSWWIEKIIKDILKWRRGSLFWLIVSWNGEAPERKSACYFFFR